MKSLTQALFQAINGFNIKENEQIILKSNDVMYCYSFAATVAGADKQALSEVVLNSLNEYYINLFYNKVDFDKRKYDSYFRNLIFK